MQKSVDFFGLILYCVFIYWLSDQQTLPTPDLFENEDKVHHFLAYFVMGVFAWRAFRHKLINPGLLSLAILSFCSLYGISDEWHQSFVVGRNSSAFDWIADSAGGLMVALCTYFYDRRKSVLHST
jgi:VanZ family protein